MADITAGKLDFTPAANASGGGYASFTFQVQDNGGTANGGVDLDPTPNTITVNVTAVNDRAVRNRQDDHHAGRHGLHVLRGRLRLQRSQRLAREQPAGGEDHDAPDCRALTDNGVAVTAGQFIAVADITAGKLKFTPAANANGTSYTSFTFQVQDNGGTANGGVDLDPTPNTITVNVTAVNDPPSGGDKTITAMEDTAYTFSAADFGFSDPSDSPANSLFAVKIATLPTAGALTDNGVAVTVGQFIALADITTGKLKFTPAANASGTNYTSFMFQVQDNGGTLNGGVDLDPTPNTITINVTSVNDSPSGSDKTITTLEDTAYTFSTADFGFSDSNDSPANTLQAVRIASLPGAGTLADNGLAVTIGQFISVTDITAGKLVFAPATNASGTSYASFTFQVQDNGGTANGGIDLDPTPNTITVNVTAVNDPPSGANKIITTLEDTTYTFSAADFGFSDAIDSPANSLFVVKITTLPISGRSATMAWRSPLDNSSARRTSRPASSSLLRQPTPTGRVTRASRSRCRITVARPMAAWISIPRRTRSPSTSRQ